MFKLRFGSKAKQYLGNVLEWDWPGTRQQGLNLEINAEKINMYEIPVWNTSGR